MDVKYDIVIIGSGLGGLMCGAILSKNGYKVCILEKNPQIGGCLQSYKADGVIFDTGVHYIGGLEEGQNLHKIFSYVGLMDKLKFERLDMEGFDRFYFKDDPREFCFAQTYERFIDTLAKQFPHEREGIVNYCNKIKNICDRFPLYNLENGDFMDKLDLLNINAHDAINSCVNDPLLQNILAGNNPLYAGDKEKTPFYIHALIINSYIESSWRCTGGGIQIARALSDIIKQNGGNVITRTNVQHIVVEDGKATKAITSDGVEYIGTNFISNLHPSTTIAMTQTEVFRKAFIHRVMGLENTIGAFVLNVAFKENSFLFKNYNIYYYSNSDVWSSMNYTPEEWPNSYAFFLTSCNNSHAHSASIMAYMKYSELEPWYNTYNTVYDPGDRGNGYNEFKEQKANKLFDLLEVKFPGFRDTVKSYHTLTPLTYRDYTGTPEGSLYGIMRDYKEPLKTFIPTRTKIPNLLLTGQNLNIHGVLGVSVSSLITCGELLGIDSLLEKIRKA
jgi:all-trans-retinol 13,14-reductase